MSVCLPNRDPHTTPSQCHFHHHLLSWTSQKDYLSPGPNNRAKRVWPRAKKRTNYKLGHDFRKSNSGIFPCNSYEFRFYRWKFNGKLNYNTSPCFRTIYNFNRHIVLEKWWKKPTEKFFLSRFFNSSKHRDRSGSNVFSSAIEVLALNRSFNINVNINEAKWNVFTSSFIVFENKH